jgi:hypothetical protein
MGATASFPAVASHLQVDFSRRKRVEPLPFGLALDGSQGRWFRREIAKVILDAHDDGLGLAAPVDDKSLLISLYPSQDLSELCAGRQSRHDFREILGGPNGGTPVICRLN